MTAMQELKKYVEENGNGVGITNEDFWLKYDELLEKEKQQIMKAYSDGLGNGQAYESNMNPISSGVLDEEAYYNTLKDN